MVSRHWRAAAVPAQSPVQVNLVSRAGRHLGCPTGGKAAKWILFCCLCLCQSHREVR